jgi:hypothetical protein
VETVSRHSCIRLLYCDEPLFTSTTIVTHFFFFCVLKHSAGIRSVVDDEAEKSNGLRSDPMCNVCEMAVVWMQNQLSQNKTQDLILDYVDQVRFVIFMTGCSTSTVLLLCFA